MKIKKGEIFKRELSTPEFAATDQKRTFRAVLSTETEVKRWFGIERLLHTKDAIVLDRAARGLPLLWDHDRGEPIGIVNNVRLDGDKLRGDVTLSKNKKAKSVLDDIRGGFLENISISYRILEAQETAEGIDATSWEIVEASIVTVPQDINAGLNRSFGAKKVKIKKKDNGAAPINAAGNSNAPGTEPGAVELERARIGDIRQEFAAYQTIPGVSDLEQRAINDGLTVDSAARSLLAIIGQAGSSQATGHAPGYTPGDDAGEKMARGMEESISMRSGLLTDKDAQAEARKSEFMGMSLSEMARAYLVNNGGLPAVKTKQSIVGEALVRSSGGNTSDNFPNILGNVAAKSLMIGYQDAPENWRDFCSVTSLQDFKLTDRVNLSEFQTLQEVPEGGEFKHQAMTDVKEQIKLATFGNLINISRQAIISDDLSAFNRISGAMGMAAARVVGDLAWSILTDNPVLNQDGLPVFHVDHNNLVTPGEAPDADVIDAMRVAMATQKGLGDAATLGIRVAHFIVPVSLETAARQLMAATYDPSATAGTLTPNGVKNIAVVTGGHRLDDDDPTAWYLAASPTAADTIEVAFLDGNDTPFLEQQNEFTRDGVTWKARIDAAAAALDYRGLQKNEGGV